MEACWREDGGSPAHTSCPLRRSRYGCILEYKGDSTVDAPIADERSHRTIIIESSVVHLCIKVYVELVPPP